MEYSEASIVENTSLKVQLSPKNKESLGLWIPLYPVIAAAVSQGLGPGQQVLKQPGKSRAGVWALNISLRPGITAAI